MFCRILKVQYGRRLIITATSGRRLLMYPLPVWTSMIEQQEQPGWIEYQEPETLEVLRSSHVLVELDKKGYVRIFPKMLDLAAISPPCEILIFGQLDHLALCREDQLQVEPFDFSEQDLISLGL